jgi:hypothetical protein
MEEVREIPIATSGKPYSSTVIDTKKGAKIIASIFREAEFQDAGIVNFKLGVYKTSGESILWKEPETLTPKSEVKLNHAQFTNLLRFLESKAGLLLTSTRKFMDVGSDEHAEALLRFKDFLANGDQEEILKLIVDSGLNRADLRNAISTRDRIQELDEFSEMLGRNSEEKEWQAWFQRNPWVLGSEFVTVLDERRIDTANTSDYLVHAADNHLDLIEIKRPSLTFWSATPDHGNLVPHPDLVKAWTQSQNYLFALEREMNSGKTTERLGLPIAKPRALLVFGRSDKWEARHFQAQRLINGGFSNLQILTYDQVKSKAQRILQLTRSPEQGETGRG